jgi:cytochrome b561
MNDLSKKYNKGTIVIHWITAILIIILFPLGKYMSGIEPVEKMGLLKVHIIFGIIVFVLTLIRSLLFFKKERPADLKTGSKFNNRLIVWIHNLFYILLFVISISGIGTLVTGGDMEAIQSNNFSLILSSSEISPLKPHGIFATIMMLLLVMHVFGVIKHFISKKENTLKRIS